MAQVYRQVKDSELVAKFEAEINNCEGPDDAIRICKKYLAYAA